MTKLSDEFLRDQTELPQDGDIREVIADMARELLALRKVADVAKWSHAYESCWYEERGKCGCDLRVAVKEWEKLND